MSNIKFLICFFLLIVSFNTATSQSIRKNYQEMTQSEKDALVAAFYTLGPTIVDEIGIYHQNKFSDIHFNLDQFGPFRPEKDVFLVWHRYQMYIMEKYMHGINPNITLPYWDWTEKNYLGLPSGQAPPANDDLFGDDFMGSFNAAWSLGRTYNSSGNYSAPTTTQVNTAQANSITNTVNPLPEWWVYSDGIESSNVHFFGHDWTGGVMGGGASPRDPIFYLHHSMIDKLFQDWLVNNNLDNNIDSGKNIYGSGDDMFQPVSLPLWDGGSSPTYPTIDRTAVDPNTYVDSRTLGVFYAENGLAELFDYTVQNRPYPNFPSGSQETFYYQYTIEAKDNFIIPSGKDAKLESVTNIIMKPGFHAQSGSSFIAKIDTDNDISKYDIVSSSRLSQKSKKVSNPFSNFRIKDDVYSKSALNREFRFIEYLKEKNKLGIEFKDECTSCKVEITDVSNNVVLSETISFGKKIDINLERLVPGMYSLKITNNKNLLIVKELKKL